MLAKAKGEGFCQFIDCEKMSPRVTDAVFGMCFLGAKYVILEFLASRACCKEYGEKIVEVKDS